MKKLIIGAASAVIAFAGLQIAEAIDVTPANATLLTFPAKAITVSDTDVVTVDQTFLILNGNGGDVTNAVTLAAATADGTLAVLLVEGTNVVKIADSGTANLSAAANLTADDTLTLISRGGKWFEVTRSAN